MRGRKTGGRSLGVTAGPAAAPSWVPDARAAGMRLWVTGTLFRPSSATQSWSHGSRTLWFSLCMRNDDEEACRCRVLVQFPRACPGLAGRGPAPSGLLSEEVSFFRAAVAPQESCFSSFCFSNQKPGVREAPQAAEGNPANGPNSPPDAGQGTQGSSRLPTLADRASPAPSRAHAWVVTAEKANRARSR